MRKAWHPVLRVEELGATPLRVALLGEPWVIVRLNGLIRAFPDRCSHRNARLSNGTVVNDTISCPYHGWRFDGVGRCVHVPALGHEATTPPTANLCGAKVTQRYGLVWIAPDTPVCDILHIPEWDEIALRKVWMPTIDINAAAAQFIDNFLDISHFPFVHAGTFGSGAEELLHEYAVRRSEAGWGFVVNFLHNIANKEDPLVVTGEHPLVQPRIMRYEYGAPFSVSLRLELPLAAMVNTIVAFCQPLDANRTRMHMVMLRNDVHDDAAANAAVQYQADIFAEDLKVIEYLYDKEVPLERGQTHTRVDRNTVEFRRIMMRLINS